MGALALASKVQPHRFEQDSSAERDWSGRIYCLRCGLPRIPDDPRHAAVAPPDPADLAALDARWLGEGDIEHDASHMARADA
jgi:hypothetical protein